MPHSIMLPLEGNSLQSERYRIQMAASQPLKKQLWAQTVQAKIYNQIIALQGVGADTKRLEILIKRVQSGDPDNIEGQAAAYYWPRLIPNMIRDRYGDPPNNLLNYGYAILRSMIARALVGSGLHLTTGIHHKNKYNAFCLADDIMEPFRPFVDILVYRMYVDHDIESFLSTKSKRHLLKLGQLDALFGKKKSPLMVGMSRTTASLYQCFAGKKRKIEYPKLMINSHDYHPTT
jgi:CRISPR-associated protein Cas1